MTATGTTTPTETEGAAAPPTSTGRRTRAAVRRRQWRAFRKRWKRWERWTDSPTIGFGSLVTASVITALLWLTTCYPLLSVLEDLLRGHGLLVLFADLPSASQPALPDGIDRVAALAPEIDTSTSSQTYGDLTALSPTTQLLMGALITAQVSLIAVCGGLFIHLLAAIRPDRADWWRLLMTRGKRLLATGAAAYGLSIALAIITDWIANESIYPADASAERHWFITLPTKSPDPFLAGLLVLIVLSHVLSALSRTRERAGELTAENAELRAETEGLV